MNGAAAPDPLNNRRRNALFAVALVVILVIAFLFRGYVRENIAPVVLFAIWSIVLLLGAVPRFVFWAIFLGVVLVIANRSLFQSTRSPALPEPEAAPPLQGRVEILTDWLEAVAAGSYFRSRLLRHLATLLLQTHSHRHRISLDDARERLESGSAAVPTRLWPLLEQGLQTPAQDIAAITKDSRLRRLADDARRRFLSNREAWEEPALFDLITFIEQELEADVDA